MPWPSSSLGWLSRWTKSKPGRKHGVAPVRRLAERPEVLVGHAGVEHRHRHRAVALLDAPHALGVQHAHVPLEAVELVVRREEAGPRSATRGRCRLGSAQATSGICRSRRSASSHVEAGVEGEPEARAVGAALRAHAARLPHHARRVLLVRARAQGDDELVGAHPGGARARRALAGMHAQLSLAARGLGRERQARKAGRQAGRARFASCPESRSGVGASQRRQEAEGHPVAADARQQQARGRARAAGRAGPGTDRPRTGPAQTSARSAPRAR